MAAHYDTAILPTRPRKPRDKAKVEAAVLIMERWILGRLRNQRFYGLAALNEAIRALLVRLNDQRPIRRLGVTRRQLLEELDRPALKRQAIMQLPLAANEKCKFARNSGSDAILVVSGLTGANDAGLE
jgi:hypothetical protein